MTGVPAAGPCACGSLLPQARCCALDLATLPRNDASELRRAQVIAAQEAHRAGDIEAAERTCLEVLELSPGQVDLLWLLSRIRASQNRAAAVEALLRRIAILAPNRLDATQDLALRLLQRGALREAEIHARNAVRLAPQNAQSHNLLGMVLTEQHQPVAGEFHYRRVLEIETTRPPILLANLAWCLKQQGRIAEARALYEESIAAAPEVFQSLLGWARLEEADRNIARATELLERAEAVAPGHPSLALLRAVLHGRAGDPDTAIAVLDGIAAGRTATATDAAGGLAPEELLEKGRLLDRIGRYDEAFAAFAAGKERTRALTGNAYLADHADNLARRLRAFFIAARLATLPRAGIREDGPAPLFVLGFPRSGTTLVEQTLSAHPAVVAGDELPFIAETAELAQRMLNSPLPYPEAFAELWMGDRREGLDNLRDHYLQRVRQRGFLTPDARMFTDKMPLNEMHLGLIGLLFPAAPLIHVLRHPLDVVLSVFSNQLTHGFYCSYSLESAARHFALVSDLVAHVRSEMTLRYLPVRYEDLVTHQEREVRRMLDFVGLPFDESCLRFHENRRYARTASYAQVSEPLYDRSRERWRRYRRHLEPVIPILMPAIERLGYSVDE